MNSDRIDHSIMINRDYEHAWDCYERLGFTLSPRSAHQVTATEGGPLVPSVTANRCAYFGTSFVELIGIVEPEAPDPWRVLPLVQRYDGLHGCSFDFGDSPTALARLRGIGLAASGVLSLQRPVQTPDGPALVRARSVHIDRAKTPEGILHTAEHLTPQYVHQPRFLRHRNGARGLAAVSLVVADDELPDCVARYAVMLARPAEPDGPRQVFALDGGRVEIVPASGLPLVWPGEVAPVLPFFVGQAVAVESVTAARTLVDRAGFATHTHGQGFFVSGPDVGGAAVSFVPAVESR